MSYRISKISIHNYRSIKNLGLIISRSMGPIVICGSNNVGKTNFLRAVNLFFNETGFKASNDIPYEIVEATRGAGYKTTVSIDFNNNQTKDKVSIKKVFREELGGNVIERSGHIKQNRTKRTNLSEDELNKFLSDFHFIFVESSNVDIPALVAQITKTNVLLGLDKLRKKQSKPLDILKNFIEESEKSLKNIEHNISKDFKDFAEGVGVFTDSLDTKEWSVKFIFPKYELLREAIGTMVNLVLQDSNQKELDAKGSGIQRILLLSLIKYISKNSKKKVIWGIDEPEVFLQPGLQKKVFEIIKDLSNGFEIFLTTHSHHFVDIGELELVFLFNAKYTKQPYRRKKDKEYIKISTEIDKATGYNKVQRIKDHLGIATNDSWEIMPYNLVVEGEEDKRYISTLLKINGLDEPKILVADGADKFPGYLVFLNLFCQDQSITPKVLSILDFDSKGKSILNSLKNKSYKFFHKVEHIVRFDKKSQDCWEYEVEDLIYPEILVRSINKILCKKGYKQLNVKKIINKKEQPSFQKDAILPFVTTQVKDANQDKEELDFKELGLKRYLCSIVCDLLIKEKDLKRLNGKYKEVEGYLRKISQPFQT